MIRKNKFGKMIFITLTLLLVIPFFPPQVEANTTNLPLPDFSPREDIAAPLNSSPTIYDGAAGYEDGKNVLYTTSKSVPAMFSVIDLDNQEILRTLPLEGAADSWHHEVAPDGTVYNAAGKYLWGYSPETKKIEILATIPEASLWALAVDEKSNAYIGTYPGGKVFKYDKETGELRDYGKMIGDIAQEYVRSMDYHDGYIYAGTGHKKIMKLDVETGEKIDIAEEIEGETSFVYDLNIVDNRYLFARYSVSKNMYIYDLQTEEWLDVVIDNVTGLHVTDSLDGNVYFVAHGKLSYINLETLEIVQTAMEYGSGLRGADWVEMKGDERLPGKSLVTVTFDGRVVFFNIETETVVIYGPLVPSTPNVINQVYSYSDDKIYISGMTGAVGAVFNPKTETHETFNIGQADVIHEHEGNVYFGVYPSGSVRVIDPEVDPLSPIELFVVGEEQERLHHMASGDGKLFIGSIPTYNKLGGAVTVYDGTSHQVYRHVVQDQSINGLAYKNGKLYGSTSITGGLGGTPTAEEAKLFIWDPETGQKVKEASLQIDGLEKPAQIGSLTIGPNDGNIWGASKGFVFAMEEETLEIVKVIEIDRNPVEGAWNSVDLQWSQDGFLYARAGNRLYVINPETSEFKFVTNTLSYTIGEDGNLYFSSPENRTILSKIEVSEAKEYEWKPISFINPGFEEGLTGWTSLFNVSNEAYFEESTDESYSGAKSLKLIDTARDQSVAVHSEDIPVVPGEDYLAEAMIKIVSGHPSLLVRMFDAEGERVGEESIQLQPGNENWQRVQLTIKAPENAVSARLFALSTSYALTEAYFDDFAFYTESEVPKDEVEYEWKPVVFTNPGFEKDLTGWSSMFGTNEEAYFEISSDTSLSGDKSLKVIDTSRTHSVAVYSEDIPVVPGEQYMAESMIKNESGHPSLLVRMYDEDGTQLREETIQLQPGNTDWQKVQLKIIAPENSAFARLFALSTSYAITEAYFDDFALYHYTEKVIEGNWIKERGKWYFVDLEGNKVTGWIKYDGNLYYLDENGVRQSGWIEDNGKRYYLNKEGVMQTGWVKYRGDWYYLSADGTMATGWIEDNEKTYYLEDNGKRKSGWVEDRGNRYYMDKNGVMQTGWVKYRGTWYFFDENGVLQES